MTIGWSVGGGDAPGASERLVSFTASDERREETREKPAPKAATRPTQTARRDEVQPQQLVPADAPQPVAPQVPWLSLSRDEIAAADIARRVPAPRTPVPSSGAMMGPVDTAPRAADSQRVGSAPNGEPLYAASWYREPSRGELDGYLSTATGPGWGLIACRTVAEYRVEDCVGIDEYPTGSNITRAVLAAAWQFRVRPPRVGGQSKVGEWVRIRIDYGMSPASSRR